MFKIRQLQFFFKFYSVRKVHINFIGFIFLVNFIFSYSYRRCYNLRFTQVLIISKHYVLSVSHISISSSDQQRRVRKIWTSFDFISQ